MRYIDQHRVFDNSHCPVFDISKDLADQDISKLRQVFWCNVIDIGGVESLEAALGNIVVSSMRDSARILRMIMTNDGGKDYSEGIA